MSAGGRGGDNRGNRRRPGRQSGRGHKQALSPGNRSKKEESLRNQEITHEKGRGSFIRPQWAPSLVLSEPIPVMDCMYCGKTIKDLSAAISDKNTGEAIHFDCIISRIKESETLEPGDTIAYIGGGRFGIVHFKGATNLQGFVIKKIFEWEIKEKRAEWRQIISDNSLVI